MNGLRVTTGPGPLIGGRTTNTGTRVSGSGLQGVPGPPGIGVATFGWYGTLQIVTGTHPWPVPVDCKATRVSVAVGTAPTGTDIVVDVLVNGVSMWTNPVNRPRIQVGMFIGSAVPELPDLLQDDILTFSIIQIGAVIPGAYLTGCVLLG